MLVNHCKNVNSHRFAWPPGILCDIALSFGYVTWKLWYVAQFFMWAFMLTQYDLYTISLVFFIPLWLRSTHLSDFSCNATGTMIILPFIAVPSMIATSSLNDQYGCSSFCTSAFVNGLPWSTDFDSMPQCSSSSVTLLISSAVMKSGMTMNDSIAFIVMHMPGIFSSLFISWLILDSQSAMNNCGPGFHSIPMLSWWIFL